MFWNRKGDMTLNIIIGAVIALVVLVVLLFIFTGGMSRFSPHATLMLVAR
jgi:uncharacterized membrane protein YqiK